MIAHDRRRDDLQAMWGLSMVSGANFVALLFGVIAVIALYVSATYADKRIAEANERAMAAGERAATLEKQAAELRLDLERERVKTAARPWTKEQFDAIQEIKGTVTDVGILWPEHCIECQMLGLYIASALHSAGAQIYGAHGVSDVTE